MTSAQAQLEADLRAQGFTTEAATAGGQTFVLLRDFTVSSGRFEGKIIDLGLEVQPSYPQHLAAALHVKAEPKLLPPGPQPNGYNILEGYSALGPDWQYWSFNFTDAWRGGQGASLSAIINRVMDNA